jgi:beta-lactamase regulating signal transducer with metallopeptidase domain
MMQFANWFSQETLRLFALVLLHFLWQGAALAGMAYAVMGACRSASARYVVGVGTMALMLAAPVASFLVLRAQHHANATVAFSTEQASQPPLAASSTSPGRANEIPGRPDKAPTYFLWLVEAWFAGVLVLSSRSAAGILMVEWLRRKETLPVTKELLGMCLSLQRRMGLERAVRYCESILLDAPAVAGWIRPVVLLPIRAVSDLSEEQLEAVIAHELAHIRRHDTLVHLFQVAVETLLFYHPVVWWLGKRIRAERENCCDDVAVALCNSPLTYAEALTRMAGWKAAPQLAMAANRSGLVERIARLLGVKQPGESFRAANLWAGVLCLFTALLAGGAFFGNVYRAQAQAQAPAPAPTVQPAATVPLVPAAAPAPAPVPAPRPATVVQPAITADAEIVPTAPLSFHFEQSASPAPQAAGSSQKQSYIDSLKDAGLSDLSVDQLIALKVQGVTGDYVRSMKDLGLPIKVDTLIGMKVQGIDPAYVRQMRDVTGETLNSDALIGLKVQGVTPEYFRGMHDLGLSTETNRIIGMKVQGITPEYVKQMRQATGESLNSDALIGMKVQGVTPEYVKQMHDLGLSAEPNKIVAMKIQGVTPEYVQEMRGLGLKVESNEIIGMKIQGVDPDYVKEIRGLGFQPDTRELVEMKVQGVDGAYIKALQNEGLQVSIHDAVAAKVQGVTPEFVAKLRSHGFKELTMHQVIKLKTIGVLDDAN